MVVIGDTAYQALFAKSGIDPIGKKVRIGAVEHTVIGVMAKRPSVGGFGNDQDNMVVIPTTTHEVLFASDATNRRGPPGQNSATIMVVPYPTATREQALQEVEQIMRIRHGLKLDEPNDFDLATQDAILRVWDQISSATFLALVVISSIALMVGGIGVMAIMMISVTERTREIGVRKALGARRQEVLFQFLMEAAVLTSIGGVLGIALGSAIGITVTLLTGFPISLPWWSFAIGLGFSAGVGIFFGMVPAVRASRLDPDRGAAPRVMSGFSGSRKPGAGSPRAPALDVFLARPDLVALEHRQHEHTAVADLAGARGRDDGFDDVVGHRVSHHHLDLHLRQQAHVVLLAAVDRGVALLLAVPPHLGHGHSGDVQLGERVLDLIDLVRADNALDQFHRVSSRVRCRSAVSASCSAWVSLTPRVVR